MNLDYIIPKISRELIKEELSKDKFVRHTNKGNNEIFIINHHDSPNVMLEIGRLREITFASSGGGTGKEVDIDELDTCELNYDQLIVWSSEDEEILGGYRFINCNKIKGDLSELDISTKHYFNLSDEFVKNYLPTTIELGRSWVQPEYQPSATNRKGLFTLDNLWDGLGALIVLNPDVEYFFGKVTMYSDYNKKARDILLSFMDYYFPDKNNLVTPIKALGILSDTKDILSQLDGLNYKDGHKLLGATLKDLEERIPPLINSYMNLSDTMKTFGTASNADFGDVEETGILVTIGDMHSSKTERHIDTFRK
ncbi:GNAT family N-acetyltransferase [Flavobacteriales bacterium]|nr:GNAT family N-acetyltransferase [Flavobacteriales bacterium]